jgi:competence ComEA-like helix-hairpin-helix protein
MLVKPHGALRPSFQTFLSACAVAASLFCGCVKLARNAPLPDGQNAPSSSHVEAAAARRINLNTATREELEKLPGVGAGLAERIVEHRERYGHFRRVEHLLIVRGISERRFREMRAFITVE